jgi:hypothetical protein
MSELLNMTDGATGNSARKVIFTTNLSDPSQMDEALLRAGRCFAVVNFRAMFPDEVIAAREAAGLPAFFEAPTEEMSLAAALVAPESPTADNAESRSAAPSMMQYFSTSKLLNSQSPGLTCQVGVDVASALRRSMTTRVTAVIEDLSVGGTTNTTPSTSEGSEQEITGVNLVNSQQRSGRCE